MILGIDFTATKFVGVICTHEGTRKHAFQWEDNNGTARYHCISLALTYSVKMEPGGQRTVPLECNRQLEDKMDIRVNAGFHHRNLNVYIQSSCINNPGNECHPQFIPLAIFNLSRIDCLYISRDTVVAFADMPAVDVYNVEIASYERI